MTDESGINIVLGILLLVAAWLLCAPGCAHHQPAGAERLEALLREAGVTRTSEWDRTADGDWVLSAQGDHGLRY